MFAEMLFAQAPTIFAIVGALLYLERRLTRVETKIDTLWARQTQQDLARDQKRRHA